MNQYFDTERIVCLACGHIWKLNSDKPITDEQHWNWVRDMLREHNEIKKGKDE